MSQVNRQDVLSPCGKKQLSRSAIQRGQRVGEIICTTADAPAPAFYETFGGLNHNRASTRRNPNVGFESREEKHARLSRVHIFKPRVFFMLPSSRFLRFATSNVRSADRCPAAPKRSQRRSHFRPFRHFSRNLAQRSLVCSVIDLSERAFRTHTHTRARRTCTGDNGRLHLRRRGKFVAHMFAVASRDVCPFTYPRASLSSFFLGQQPAGGFKRSVCAGNSKFTSSSRDLSSFPSFFPLSLRFSVPRILGRERLTIESDFASPVLRNIRD